MKANYHTHTYLCGHAQGTVIEYVAAAHDLGLEVIGISDHAPNKRVNDVNVRMKPSQLQGYLEEIEHAQTVYQGKITILKGLEVEYFADHEDYYKELRSKLDYLIHGQHYISMTDEMHNLISGFALHTKEQIYKYSDYLLRAMNSNHFDVLAHPDLYMCGYRDFDEHAIKVAHIICQKAEETNTILEWNANGYRRGAFSTPQGIRPPYPRIEFWDIVKQYNIKTILGSDCHSPDYIYDETIKEAEAEYIKTGVQRIEFLDLKHPQKNAK